MTERTDAVRRYYRDKRHAGGYNELRFAHVGGRFTDDWEKEIVASLLRDHPPGEPLLEVAAGTGRFSLMLARRHYRVVAVDSSPAMLDQLRDQAQRENLPITCIRGDAFRLPFADGAFQTVFSIRFVWHFDDIAALATEFARVARGHVVFDLLNRNSLASLTVPVANHITHRSSYMRLATSRQAREILQSAGLDPVEERSAFVFPYFFYRRLPWLANVLHANDRAVLRRFPGVGSVLYFKARKSQA